VIGLTAARDHARYLRRMVRASRSLDAPLRFVALQLAPPRTAEHRLKSSGLTVYLRHRTRDIDIFKEVFGTEFGPNGYEPPAPLAAALDARCSGAPAGADEKSGAAGGPARALDLGGNIGLFGLYALGRWPDISVHSFEPDPSNLPMIRRAVAGNALERRWTVTGAAVSNEEGSLPFVSGLFAESQLAAVADPASQPPDSASLDDGRTVDVPVVDLFELDHRVALLKIDIEGAEWAILADPRMRELQAEVIVLEWHVSGCPEPDPRAAAVRMLAEAGYTQQRQTQNLSHTGVVWAWREGESVAPIEPG
jgi:FkbM family methyltransferase